MSQFAHEFQILGETIRRGIATEVNHTLAVVKHAGKVERLPGGRHVVAGRMAA